MSNLHQSWYEAGARERIPAARMASTRALVRMVVSTLFQVKFVRSISGD